MAEKELDIEIRPDGKVTVHPKGFKGEECTHLAELFARILGKEEQRQYTSEYYDLHQNLQQHQDVKRRR